LITGFLAPFKKTVYVQRLFSKVTSPDLEFDTATHLIKKKQKIKDKRMAPPVYPANAT
jgi:hypothetical protein